MTMTENHPWPPKYVFHEFLFDTHEKQMVRAEKKDFARSRNWSILKISL